MTNTESFRVQVDPSLPKGVLVMSDGVNQVEIVNIGTDPKNFRRDREWPCCVPGCKRDFHTAEQMQIHFRADHTDEEKEAAWAKVPAFLESKRQVFALVRVGER